MVDSVSAREYVSPTFGFSVGPFVIRGLGPSKCFRVELHLVWPHSTCKLARSVNDRDGIISAWNRSLYITGCCDMLKCLIFMSLTLRVVIKMLTAR